MWIKLKLVEVVVIISKILIHQPPLSVKQMLIISLKVVHYKIQTKQIWIF